MKYLNKKNTPAFTMIELVLVIVVLGILASLAMPRLDRDLRQEAADNILSAIRYTQHLALNDDKHAYNDPDWHQKLWQIRFEANARYTVYSDMNQGGNADPAEIAIDPANGKRMDGTDATIGASDSPNVFLGDKYGINNITLAGCNTTNGSTAKGIAFDHLGRPHRGVAGTANTNTLNTYVNTDCIFTFQSPAFDTNIVIQIRSETGYAQIVNQDNS